MKSYLRQLKRSVIFLVLFTTSTYSHALTVFDPANFSQNLMTAIRSYMQVVQTIYFIQQEFQHLKSLTDPSNLASLLIDIAGLQTEFEQISGIAMDIATIRQEFRSIYDLDFKNISLIDLAGKTDEWAGQTFSAIQDAMQIQAKVKDLLESNKSEIAKTINKSMGAIGQTSQAQVMAQSLGVLSNQLNQVNSLLIASNQAAQSFQMELAATRRAIIEKQRRRFATWKTITNHGGMSQLPAFK